MPNIDITRRLLYSRDEFMKIGEKDSFNPQMIEGYNAEELPFGPGRKKVTSTLLAILLSGLLKSYTSDVLIVLL